MLRYELHFCTKSENKNICLVFTYTSEHSAKQQGRLSASRLCDSSIFWALCFRQAARLNLLSNSTSVSGMLTFLTRHEKLSWLLKTLGFRLKNFQAVHVAISTGITTHSPSGNVPLAHDPRELAKTYCRSCECQIEAGPSSQRNRKQQPLRSWSSNRTAQKVLCILVSRPAK